MGFKPNDIAAAMGRAWVQNRAMGQVNARRRARVGTGDIAKRKRWEAEMSRGSGYFLALVTKSEANLRDRWDTRKRTKTNRGAVRHWLRSNFYWHGTPKLPARITLTRYGKGTLDDDNIRPALKAVRDGIADAFFVDDGDPRYDWQYKQVKAPFYGVRIEIESV